MLYVPRQSSQNILSSFCFRLLVSDATTSKAMVAWVCIWVHVNNLTESEYFSLLHLTIPAFSFQSSQWGPRSVLPIPRAGDFYSVPFFTHPSNWIMHCSIKTALIKRPSVDENAEANTFSECRAKLMHSVTSSNEVKMRLDRLTYSNLCVC